MDGLIYGLDPRLPGVKDFCLNVEQFFVITRESCDHLGIDLTFYCKLADQDFRSFLHNDAVAWKPLDDLSIPEECMHHWLQECVLNPCHVDTKIVQCWQTDYYLLIDASCDLVNKYAAVLVYDCCDAETKIFCFK